MLFQGTTQASGGGFGGNTTLLTIQANTTERGCIAWTGATQIIGKNTSSACVITTVPPSGGGASSVAGGDESTGQNQTQIRTIADTGALNANQIRFVFNANEGGGGNSTIRLDDLIINFFAPNGALIWSSSQSVVQPAWAPMTFDDPTGTGTSGQAFRLYFEDTPTVQALVFNRPDWQDVRVGAQMAATQSNSGGDNLFVTNNAALGLAEIPEPATFGVFGAGLIALVVAARRRVKTTGL